MLISIPALQYNTESTMPSTSLALAGLVTVVVVYTWLANSWKCPRHADEAALGEVS